MLGACEASPRYLLADAYCMALYVLCDLQRDSDVMMMKVS